MARTRQIRPGFWLDDDLLEIEERTGLGAFVRFAFMGLIAHADREGRFRWRPRTLQAQIDPCRSFKLVECMDALVESGHVERYEVDGEVYGRVLNFLKHQKIDSREMASKLPASPSENPAEVSAKVPRNSGEGSAASRRNSVSEVPRYRGTEEEKASSKPLSAPADAPAEKPDDGTDELAEKTVETWNAAKAAHGLDAWPNATKPRQKTLGELRARVRESGGPDGYAAALLDRLERMAASPHYQGANGWTPALPWLLTANGWEKSAGLPPPGASAKIANRPTKPRQSGMAQLARDLAEGGTVDERLRIG